VSKEAAVLATVCAGGLVAIQAPVNARLGGQVGKFAAATISFSDGLAVLIFITCVLAGGIKTTAGVTPWWVWVFGGCAGAAYVTTALSSIPALGAGGVTAATVAGQLTVAVVADRAGLLDLPEKPVTIGRVAGVLLLGLGVFLIVRE
jgi:transporter family-2 protein